MNIKRGFSLFLFCGLLALICASETWAQNRTGVEVGNPVSVASAMTEATVAVIPPGTNNACPGGKLFLASSSLIASVNLNNTSNWSSSLRNLAPEAKSSKDLSDPLIIQDNHLVATKDGRLFHTFEAIIWRDDLAHPSWWDQTKTNTLKNKNVSGGRGAIFVFTSTDCGTTWVQLPTLDAAKVDTKSGAKVDPGYCGVPRVNAAKKTAEAGGWDGHYLHVNLATNDLYLTTICATGNSPWLGLLLRSRDGGQSWLVERKIESPPNFWRVPINSLSNSVVGFAYSQADKKAHLNLLNTPQGLTEQNDIPITTLSYPSDSDTATSKMSDKVGLNANMYAYLSLANSRETHSLGNYTMKTEGFIVATYCREGEEAFYKLFNYTPGSAPKFLYAIKSEKKGASVLHGTLVDAEGQNAPYIFYWLEQVDKGKFEVRFKVFKGQQEIGTTKTIGTSFTTPLFTGDYLGGSSYRTREGWVFYLSWSESGTLKYVRVFVP